jgi:aspartate ammonia-lyase
MMRTETDFLGNKEIPAGALFGIHSLRAKENFPDTTPFLIEWYKAVGDVKYCCYQTYQRFKKAVFQKFPDKQLNLKFIEDEVLTALEKAALEVSLGKYFEHFIVPAVQGGAGTSINMNINEIIANVALVSMGKNPGDYLLIDPIEMANIYQSTNDVIPTALKISVMRLLVDLEAEINNSRTEIERIETSTRNVLRVAYTQMQAAVPSSYGNLFSTYSDALSRDWWRVSKCFERIKIVNAGGGAIGTGLAIPRFFIMELAQTIQQHTRLPITRAENMQDATANLDSYVEVHAILKAHAVNLEKMVSDIRLLASDLVGKHEITIPQQQAGSSIMPGKVNPVIPEFVVSVAHKIYANDQLISSLCAQGCLDLNAYLPLIGHALLESLKLLIAANKTLKNNLLAGLVVNVENAELQLLKSPAIATALNPVIGYHSAANLAKEMKNKNIDIKEANKNLELLTDEELENLLKPENLLRKGFSVEEK